MGKTIWTIGTSTGKTIVLTTTHTPAKPKIDAESLTRKQIETLQIEAGVAGDQAMADLCEWALDGCPIALQAVADAIAAASSTIDA